MKKTLVPKNPSFREMIDKKLAGQELMKRLHIELTTIEPGYTEATMKFEKMHEQQDGFVHGGLTATIADIVSGFAAYTLVDKEERVLTADIRTSYFRPGRGEKILAKGWVEKAGRNFHFCEAEVYCYYKEEWVLIAKSSSTMAVVRKADPDK